MLFRGGQEGLGGVEEHDAGDFRRHLYALKAAFRAAAYALHDYLARQGVAHPHVSLDERLPIPDRRSGKLREVIIELGAQASDDPDVTPHSPSRSPRSDHARDRLDTRTRDH